MFATLMASGIIRLSAPTLFMKADRTATSPDSENTCMETFAYARIPAFHDIDDAGVFEHLVENKDGSDGYDRGMTESMKGNGRRG